MKDPVLAWEVTYIAVLAKLAHEEVLLLNQARLACLEKESKGEKTGESVLEKYEQNLEKAEREFKFLKVCVKAYTEEKCGADAACLPPSRFRINYVVYLRNCIRMHHFLKAGNQKAHASSWRRFER